MQADNVLEVEHLDIMFPTAAGRLHVVRDVSFAIARGQTLALVGESGSGKSVASLGILRLNPPNCIMTGRIRLRGRDGQVHDVLQMDAPGLRVLRGPVASMVFQEPMTSFNPLLPIGRQVVEGLLWHQAMPRREALERAEHLLELVGIPEPRRRLSAYPHELSGGMRQRAMIALALSCDPALLIADEPTTALDVTIQAQILELLQRLQQDTGMAMIFITHNLGVVAEIADRVAVMYAGRIVEMADVLPLFRQPRMPYTAGLLDSVPRLDLAGRRRGTLPAIPGNVPDPYDLPPGCSFSIRCKHAQAGVCDTAVPELEDTGALHSVRCARWQDISTQGRS